MRLNQYQQEYADYQEALELDYAQEEAALIADAIANAEFATACEAEAAYDLADALREESERYLAIGGMMADDAGPIGMESELDRATRRAPMTRALPELPAGFKFISFPGKVA